MSALFALRGSSLTPRYALGGKGYAPFVAAVNLSNLPAVITAASISATGTKGSSLIDVHLTNSDERALKYVAGRNWVSGTNVFTVRYSFVPNWGGLLANDKNLFLIGHDPNRFNGGLRVQVFDNGKINVAMRTGDGVGSDMLSAATTASAVTVTNKQKMEIQVACNGTRVYLSIDGVAAGDWPLQVTNRYMNGVLAGNIYLGVFSIDSYIDEFLIFDTFEPQVYTPSASYLTVDDLDGTVANAPADVRSGVACGLGSGVGTMVAAAKATTKIGVAADDGTGEYYAAERWDDLDPSLVARDTAYKANSETANRTGELDNVTNVLGNSRIVLRPSHRLLLRSNN